MTSLDCQNRWVAVQVAPRREKIVAAILANKGYEEFVPFTPTPSRASLRRRAMPLIPGYVFCRFDQKKELIVTTPGVIRIVGVGRAPVPLEDHEIRTLQSIASSGLPAGPSRFECGHRVKISTGALRGVEGVIVRRKNSHHIIVSVELLQRWVWVEIDALQLEESFHPSFRLEDTSMLR